MRNCGSAVDGRVTGGSGAGARWWTDGNRRMRSCGSAVDGRVTGGCGAGEWRW
ncbi:hypothetical protein [Bacillus sp. FJAT-28004]|uniref:hypothetical protein n=1 Tax=Bacillus sp. FJAT-28004 TaxID=1679165 RepID=UPI00137926DF|nr:hypothetical protein [Bacillus sp. FJAT-28004]